MKIAIDIRTILPTRSGVGNYVLNLVENLLQAEARPTFYFLCRKKNMELLPNLERQGIPLRTIFSHENHPLGDLWEHFILPLRLQQCGVEIFHGPASLIPFWKKNFRIVVTIHDLVAFLFPNTIPLKYGAYMRYILRYAVRRADKIISVSNHTREDLIRILKVPAEKIAVVHEAPTPVFHPLNREAVRKKLSARYGLKKKFIYHLGNIEPRKNLIVLLQAFQEVCRHIQNEYVLVLTGQPGWLTGNLQRYLNGYPLKERIIFTGYIPPEDLALFMNGAEMFVFPSLYEGFGLPVLEAMSCGTPVISSNRSSIPEIVGPAAILIDPENPRELADKILFLIQHPEEREALRIRGLEQAARFTWPAAAQKTLGIYQSLMARPAEASSRKKEAVET